MTCARMRRYQREMCAELESVAVSNDPENPPIHFGDTAFLRRQQRIEKALQISARGSSL
jgi:hypothetical protein